MAHPHDHLPQTSAPPADALARPLDTKAIEAVRRGTGAAAALPGDADWLTELAEWQRKASVRWFQEDTDTP